jgi:poly(beta-D-mannuronate) lyase
MLTLRHGNRCRVEGNFFLGRGKRGSGGIRVIGEDHVVINNYIEGVTQGGIWLTSGAVNPPLVGYVEANRCLVAFNSILHSRGPCVELDAGLGSSQRTLRPSGVVIANNVFAPLEGGTVFKGKAGEDFRWMGNVVSATNVAADGNWPGVAGVEGVRRESVTLARRSDGLLRPNPDGPWRGAAAGNWPDIRTDMDGQLRFGKLDCGADQLSDEAILKRPLNRGEVGPVWMRPTALVTPPASSK